MSGPRLRRRRVLWAGLFVGAVALLAPDVAEARLGGGSSYSGSRSSSRSSSTSTTRSSSSRSSTRWSTSRSTSRSTPSSRPASRSVSSGGGGGAPIDVVDLISRVMWVILLAGGGLALFFFISVMGDRPPPPQIYTALRTPPPTSGPRPTPTRVGVAERIQMLDPSFSEPIFLEWLSLLYTRFHEARGSGDVDAIAAYLAPNVLQLPPREGVAVRDIRGVIIGRVALKSAQQVADALRVVATFHANSTAVDAAGREQAFYVHEDWVLERRRGRQSRGPDAIQRLGCPGCGAATQRTTLGRCTFCQTSTIPGDADFALVDIRVASLERRPPLLTGHVEEVGTDLPSVVSPVLEATLSAWKRRNPPVDMHAFTRRARTIFFALQEGWSACDPEQLRPWETDPLFQQHRFWINEYLRQGLQNRLGDITLSSIQIVKATSDAWYDAVTARMSASMRECTVRVQDGVVVAGNPAVPRVFTEYWTFIRTRDARGGASDITCPSCMAPLKVNQAGVCAWCQTHLTRGEFDWTLSRIEQDEEYQG